MSARSFRRNRERRIEAARRRTALRTRRAGLASVAAGAFALTAGVSPASALNLEVNTLADGAADACDPLPAGCTLRDAIEAADATGEDDFITFQAGLTGTIRLTAGELEVYTGDFATTITGPGETDPIAVSGDADDNGPDAGDSPVLALDQSDVYLSGLTLTEGYGDAAGAVFVDEDSYLSLDDAAVTGSTATGAQFPGPGTYDIYVGGGGILNFGTTVIAGSEISDNESAAGDPMDPGLYGGGGIQNSGRLEVADSVVSENIAEEFGGGIFQGFPSAFPQNTSLDISDSVISGNAAEFGGGISGISPDKYGAGRKRIVDTTIVGNFGDESGGGVGIGYVGGSTRWTITHSTIAENGSPYGGGLALGEIDGSVDIVDSTISGNGADTGGGVAAGEEAQKYEGAVRFDNSTIAGNYATTNGGGMFLEGSDSDNLPMPVSSTIIADNIAAGVPNDLDQGGSGFYGGADLSFSLVEEAGDAVLSQTPGGSSILGVDPQLGPLADNGGPTDTHLPAATSPVIDKGDSPGQLETDQRGDPRRVESPVANASDGTDIGSVELAFGPPPPPGPPAGPAVEIGSVKSKNRRKRVVRTKKDRVRIRVKFSSEIPGATFECQVDDGDFETCDSPFRARVDSKGGKGKKHSVTIRARNAAGELVGDPVVVRFRVIKVG